VHELAVCEAIADTVHRSASGRGVATVSVAIGHLRQVVPDSLLFNWEILTKDTDLEGACLVVEEIPARVDCSECGAQSTLEVPVLACMACGGLDVTLVSGEEFMIRSIDVREE
jgi:hydrogenase nickel incorporation protein HypA/HybF